MKSLIASLFLATAPIALASCSGLLAKDRIEIVSDTIGGVVTSRNGPEAGVWVIAETNDLANRYIKIVVTDDKGRYLLPELPKANYKVWVRGYGLVDSQPILKKPGERADLTATVAPDAKAAAQYFPASSWYALVKPPSEADFAKAGLPGSGIPAEMMSQQHFLEQLKERCLVCHQVGGTVTRTRASPDNTTANWDERMQRFPGMHASSQRLGERGLQMLVDWSNGIAAGATPPPPKRPAGVERNIVVTVVGWSAEGWLHDQTSSDRLAPATNAAGPIYGMGMHDGRLYFMDPKTLNTSSVPIPGPDGTPHDGGAAPHSSEMDNQGRIWAASVANANFPQPSWCFDGSTASSRYFPLQGDRYQKAMQLPMYDPRTKQVTNHAICTGGNHGSFTFNGQDKFYLSGDTETVSWVDRRIWDQTKDMKKAFKWCPMVLDTNGDGKIDPDRANWVQPNSSIMAQVQGEYGARLTKEQARELAALKPAKGKDLRISRYLYGLGAAPDGGVWAAAYIPSVPSGIVYLNPGANAPETCVAEYYEPPLVNGEYLASGARGVGSDLQGRAWVGFSSGQVGVFDRRKCKVRNGPTATGQHCPEGWTVFDLPYPKVGGSPATADMAYSHWGDYSNVMGLGKDSHFFPLVNSDAIVALPEGSKEFVRFTVPYPLGFYTRGLDFRMESAKADWKGRSMHAVHTSSVLHHQEGGMESPGQQQYIFKVRPNPLAH